MAGCVTSVIQGGNSKEMTNKPHSLNTH